MSTAEIVMTALGAWFVGSVLLGLLIGRMLRLSRRRARPPLPGRAQARPPARPRTGPQPGPQPGPQARPHAKAPKGR